MVDVGSLDSLSAIDCLVTAHRGSPLRRSDGLGPVADNSLLALRASVAASIPFLEVDVRMSDEGDLFLFHDGSLSSANSYSPRSLHGRPISKLSRQERSQVSLAQESQISIPSLDQALDVVADSATSLQLDLKGESDRLALAVIERVAARNLLSRVVLQVREPTRIARIKQRYPAVHILARCTTPQQLADALGYGAEFVELERWIDSDAIRQVHRSKARVLINLSGSRLDEPGVWRYLRTRGVDILMSDRASEHRCSTNTR